MTRLLALKELAERLGLSTLAELQIRAARQRTVPDRLVTRLAKPSSLTPRQREIMVLLASGFTRKEMAEELGVSEETVKAHLRHAYRKLGVGDRVQAINAFLEEEC